jgi:hypothetical protein
VLTRFAALKQLASDATRIDQHNANVKLQHRKEFLTKYGADFDPNLGNLKLLEESVKVNKKLHEKFKFTSGGLLHDLQLFKIQLESQQTDFAELICYLIDTAIYVHQNKLGDDLILPSKGRMTGVYVRTTRLKVLGRNPIWAS